MICQRPDQILTTKCALNIQSTNDRCFTYCMYAVKHDLTTTAVRQSVYNEFDDLNVRGLKFPMAVCDISKFESQNTDFSINVYRLVKHKSLDKDRNGRRERIIW